MRHGDVCWWPVKMFYFDYARLKEQQGGQRDVLHFVVPDEEGEIDS